MSGGPRLDPEFRRLIPPLAEDERAQLESNLVAARGARDVLIAWNGLLLDGHNRYEICERLGLSYRVKEIALEDRRAARIWIHLNQLGRRNLTDDQRSIQAARLEREVARQSKRERAKAGRRAGGDATPEQLAARRSEAAVSSKRSGERVRVKVARQARISQRKVKQAAALLDRAPELVEQVSSGELTLAEATRQLKPAVRAEKLARVIWPTGQHGVILADPPWRPDEGLLDPTRKIENQYPTLALEELKALRPHVDEIAAPDCVLLLWTTSQKLIEAGELLAAWGFEVKSGAVWIKPSIGMGYWFRQRHELLILATRGNPLTPLEADRPDSVIEAPRRGHSEKPDIVYELVEQMFPQIPKVEIFARARRPGWSYGTNERQLREASSRHAARCSRSERKVGGEPRPK